MAENIKEKNIANAFSEVHKYDQSGEHERAVKACNRILQLEPQEPTAFHCKIVCLVHLSRFEEALQSMNKNAAMASTLYFERAYCQYRLNQNEEALTTLQSVDANQQALHVMELKAQVCYRLEKYKDAVTVYSEVIKNVDDDYEDERETNLSAAISLCDKNDINKNIANMRDDTYDLCYNKACSLLGVEQYNEAERLLKKAEKLCREAFEEEGAAEDEIEIELAHVRIQMGYVYQRQGRQKEAQQQYASALRLKLDDIALIAVASNNSVVLNRNQNVFDSRKKIRAATNEGLVHKLPAHQRKYIALNAAIFAHQTNQTDHCARLCAALEQQWPDLGVEVRVLSAMSLVEKQRLPEAIALLRAYNASTPDSQLQLHLTCLHLLLAQGDKEQACILIEGLGSKAYRPGIIGALITLYLHMGKEETALSVFEETVEWYRKNEKAEQDLSTLWRQAAEFHMRNGRPQVAAKSLEQLIASQPNDRRAIAQLVLALAQCINAQDNKDDDAHKRISLISKRLGDVSSFASSIDTEILESATWLNAKKGSTVSKNELSPGAPETGDKKKRKHRKRRGKLPANYDAGMTPDPERWLPKYERTGFRKKRDRRAKDIIKGSQGTASGQSDQFDFSTKAQEPDSTTPESTPQQRFPGNQHQPTRKNNAKKSSKSKRR